MKKLLVMLCMLTCIFGLSACGSTANNSEVQQMKIENAKAMATDFVVPYMMNFFDDEIAAHSQENYNVHELEAMAEDELNYLIYLYSQYGITYNFSTIDVEGIAILNGIVSYNNTYESLGDIDMSTGFTADCKVSGDQLIVTVPVTGSVTDENGNVRTAQAEVIFSNDIFLTVESCALNIEQTIPELMMKAAMDTLMGMGTVFVVLILISFIIWMMGFISKVQNKQNKKADEGKKEDVKTIKTDAVDNTIAQIIEKEEQAVLADDLELVAVIAAAIAASEGAVSTDGFVVRSIRKRR